MTPVTDLLTEETWCKEAYALDGKGNYMDAHDPKACKFCLMGAVKRCYVYGAFDQGPKPELAYNQVVLRLGRLLMLPETTSIITLEGQIEEYNDNSDWPAIRELVRRANI